MQQTDSTLAGNADRGISNQSPLSPREDTSKSQLPMIECPHFQPGPSNFEMRPPVQQQHQALPSASTLIQDTGPHVGSTSTVHRIETQAQQLSSLPQQGPQPQANNTALASVSKPALPKSNAPPRKRQPKAKPKTSPPKSQPLTKSQQQSITDSINSTISMVTRNASPKLGATKQSKGRSTTGGANQATDKVDPSSAGPSSANLSTLPSQPGPSSAAGPIDEHGLEMNRLVLSGELILVPTILTLSEGALRQVLSYDTYNKLPDRIKKHLARFLPKFDEPAEQEKSVQAAFTKSNSFNFGNPLGKFHAKLKGGYFNPDRAAERVQLRDNQRVLYDHYIRFYQINMLKRLLASRHALLQHYMTCSPHEEPGPVPLDAITISKREQYARIQQRASKRTRLMLADCRSRVGQTGVSSDEEDEDIGARQSASAAGRTTLYAAQHKDMDLHQPLYIDDVRTMVKKYKKLKRFQPNTPSLDISGIELDDVLERSGVQSVSERVRQTKQTLERMN